jgi:HTH-type transcriptional regulator / antitoxin HigA
MLEVLGVLVSEWEREHVAIPVPDPIDAILFRLEQQGLTPRELEPMLGSRRRVSEVLGRRRPLTLPMIRALHRCLGIPLESLVAEPAQR